MREYKRGNYTEALWRSALIWEKVILDKVIEAVDERFHLKLDPDNYKRGLRKLDSSRISPFLKRFYHGNINNLPGFLEAGRDGLRLLQDLKPELEILWDARTREYLPQEKK